MSITMVWIYHERHMTTETLHCNVALVFPNR